MFDDSDGLHLSSREKFRRRTTLRASNAAATNTIANDTVVSQSRYRPPTLSDDDKIGINSGRQRHEHQRRDTRLSRLVFAKVEQSGHDDDIVLDSTENDIQDIGNGDTRGAGAGGGEDDDDDGDYDGSETVEVVQQTQKRRYTGRRYRSSTGAVTTEFAVDKRRGSEFFKRGKQRRRRKTFLGSTIEPPGDENGADDPGADAGYGELHSDEEVELKSDDDDYYGQECEDTDSMGGAEEDDQVLGMLSIDGVVAEDDWFCPLSELELDPMEPLTMRRALGDHQAFYSGKVPGMRHIGTVAIYVLFTGFAVLLFFAIRILSGLLPHIEE